MACGAPTQTGFPVISQIHSATKRRATKVRLQERRFVGAGTLGGPGPPGFAGRIAHSARKATPGRALPSRRTKPEPAHPQSWPAREDRRIQRDPTYGGRASHASRGGSRERCAAGQSADRCATGDPRARRCVGEHFRRAGGEPNERSDVATHGRGRCGPLSGICGFGDPWVCIDTGLPAMSSSGRTIDTSRDPVISWRRTAIVSACDQTSATNAIFAGAQAIILRSPARVSHVARRRPPPVLDLHETITSVRSAVQFSVASRRWIVTTTVP